MTTIYIYTEHTTHAHTHLYVYKRCETLFYWINFFALTFQLLYKQCFRFVYQLFFFTLEYWISSHFCFFFVLLSRSTLFLSSLFLCNTSRSKAGKTKNYCMCSVVSSLMSRCFFLFWVFASWFIGMARLI